MGDDCSDQRWAVQNLLPTPVAENLDVNVWGWFSYLYDSDSDNRSYWDADVAAGATQRLGDRLALTAYMHFIDDNNHTLGFLEQAFATAKASEKFQTLITAGKFNANFGVEPRNAWDRLGGTTSLLFGAEPQDLLGVMVTQPLGNSGLTVRPFVVSGFQGTSNFNQPPSGGATIEYHTTERFSWSVTNWVGPGVEEVNGNGKTVGDGYSYGYTDPPDDSDDEADEYDYSSTAYTVGDWRGPNLQAQRGGTLYFLDGKIQWMPREDLTLAAEGLLAMRGPSAGTFGWGGFLLLANFDITDHWRAFGRWSFLDDPDGLVSGVEGLRHELSVGAGYQPIQGIEIRGEYRHDFNVGGDDLDSVSVHLTFSY